MDSEFKTDFWENMKIDNELLNRIKQDYALHRRLSTPYLQRKFKISAELAQEIVKHLTVGMKK